MSTEQKLAEDRRRNPPYLAFGRGFVSPEDNYGAADAKVQLNGNGCVYVAEYICDDRDRRHDAEIDQFIANEHIAWCRYLYDEAGGIRSIVTCDSDAKGAFKVYRHPAAASSPASPVQPWSYAPDEETLLDEAGNKPTSETPCACRTFALDPITRAYLDGCDFVHTVIACPETKLNAATPPDTPEPLTPGDSDLLWVNPVAGAVANHQAGSAFLPYRRVVDGSVVAREAEIELAVKQRPRIICLCGSTRFIEQFAITTWELEREGFIVLGCTLLPMWYCQVPSHFGEATGTKEQCDELHKRKIDLADEVLVLNIGGYIGESTRSEIEYAARLGKPVRYVEPDAAALRSGKES